jgi:nucleoside-diphosphate-sugar epimerase
MSVMVVTGASGFLGSHVCRDLEARGLEFIAIGNRERPSFKVAMTFEQFARTPLSQEGSCIHCAGTNRMSGSRTEAKELQVGLQLADVVLKKNFTRVVLVSSAAVYGDTNSAARSENEVIDPRSSYAKLKAQLEEPFRKSGAIIARISNLYGPGMSTANVISEMATQLLSTQNAVEVKNSNSVRDYIFVEDAAAALTQLALHEAAAGIYNIGSAKGYTVSEVYTCLQVVLGRQKPLKVVGSNEKPSWLTLDASRIYHDIGWRAKIEMEAGLRRTFVGNH